MLSDAERHRLLVEWNATEAEYPRGKCIHELFEEQVARTPDAVAVVYAGDSLTYSELNARANQLAHYLRRRGVGPDVLVGICVERSLEMVVGLLGILKAGGAYVPLDPAYPEERLRFMLSDGAAQVLLTQERLLERLPKCSAAALCLDASGEQFSRESSDNPVSAAHANNLAYLIYTSGSTGQPKGVMVPHRALSNLVAWMQRAFPLDADDRVLQKTPFSFDVSVWEFFGPLLAGARLVMARPGAHRDCAYLVETMRTHQVTVLQVVPSLLAVLVDEPGFASCASLRHVISAGEPLTPETTRRFHARGVAALHNLYGPTETCIYSTFWHCRPDNASQVIPIGRPIANTQVYILDGDMQPVPVGVPGELYIGGDGLARGYLNRPELTAERFVASPLAGMAGASPRLYRTGDRVRYLPDGNIEFLGRLDDQVKIRGFRIEPGEVEAVLAGHPRVRAAAVIAREGASAGRVLVAYVVPHPGVPPSAAELRSFVAERLPEYMVPAAFVLMDALPLTPNGKLDRRALPAPDPACLDASAAPAAPRTPVEELLAGIWRELLGLERVGIHDSFFALGGHSLLAMRVVARVREALGVDLPVGDVFEAPTPARLAERLEAALRAGRQAQLPEIHPVPREGHIPLSFAQQRLWFLHQVQPDVSAYHVPLAYRLQGFLDPDALQRTLAALVARHEPLRTCFAAEGGIPRQVIFPAASVNLRMVDIRHLPEPERQAEARRLAVEDARRPFDLERDQMLRAALVRIGEEEHLLAITVHHVAFDGWSVGVLEGELAALYGAFVKGEPASLPDLPAQYADYAQWQRACLDGDALDGLLGHWRGRLEGAPALLDLPADHARPGTLTYRGACQPVAIARPLLDRLEAIGREEGATQFMVLLAAYAVLLRRWAGQEDIVIGSPVAGREPTQTEGLVGFFVNTLALRVDLSGDPTFRELLRRVRQVAFDAYAHRDLPFEVLVDGLQAERSPAYHPLFQAALALENTPGDGLALPGLRAEPVPLDLGCAMFDLTMSLHETPEGLVGSVEYSTDLFDHATVARMLGHLQVLLQGIKDAPDRRVSELPLLTEEERHQLLVEWNATEAEYPRDKCIHELFEEQAARTPDAVAVVYEGDSLTYSELNARANQLAHYLRERGVGPDVLVGLCIERSLETVVGLLGILKAGGAYVPLDPDYPEERLRFMIRDADVPLLLTQQALLAALPRERADRICLDSDWPAIARESAENLTTASDGGSLAYVMYTSGSTGTPKGVEVPHRAVLRLLVGVDYVRLDAGRRILQLAPICFDASTFEIWGALLHGGKCVLFPQGVPTPAALGRAIREQGVTTLWLTASLFNAIIDEAPETLAGVEELLTGGEALSVPHVMRAFRHLRSARITNGYGPTESTTFACCYRIPRPLTGEEPSVPIGRPIANTQVYILDGDMQPVPVGVPGELYIGGDGLARGYLNRPELTAERFVASPLAGMAGASPRLYRTGDRVRYLPDGNIEFLGRLDDQVKIRGFRIEPGEVEAVLAAHPRVGSAVVSVREDVPGEKRLVAYVVASSGASLAPSELRAHLRENLPDYMVPSAFVLLDAIPLTPNGKVDHRALRAPEDIRCESGLELAAPADDLERHLVGCWERVLGCRPIAVTDNFFDVGGHSLMAVRLFADIERICGKRLPVSTLFHAPSIRELAAVLRQDGWMPPWISLVPIQPGGSRKALFCVHAVNGMSIYYRKLAQHLGADRPVYGLDAPHPNGRWQPYARVEDAAAGYLAEIRSVQPEGPYHLCGVSFGGVVAFEMALQLRAEGHEVGIVALLDAVAPGHGRFLPLLPRLRIHLANLARLPLRQEWIYARVRARAVVRRASFAAYTAIGDRCRQEGSALPERLRGNAQAVHLNALSSYVPRSYPGRVLLFRAAVQAVGFVTDRDLGWGELAAGGVEICDMPGQHDEMVNEPLVALLARELAKHLDAAERYGPLGPPIAPETPETAPEPTTFTGPHAVASPV